MPANKRTVWPALGALAMRTRFTGALEFRWRETPRTLLGPSSEWFLDPHMRAFSLPRKGTALGADRGRKPAPGDLADRKGVSRQRNSNANRRFAPSRPRLSRWLPAILLLATATVCASEPEGLRGPDVTIIAGEERTIYEYRQNGHLRMVKIVPNWGKPYYLFPRDQTAGFGNLEEADMLLPTWVIVNF